MTLTDDLCDGLDVGYAEQALRGALRAERGGALDEHPFVIGVEDDTAALALTESPSAKDASWRPEITHAQPCNLRSWGGDEHGVPLLLALEAIGYALFRGIALLGQPAQTKPSCTMTITNNSSITRSPPRTLPHADYHPSFGQASVRCR